MIAGETEINEMLKISLLEGEAGGHAAWIRRLGNALWRTGCS